MTHIQVIIPFRDRGTDPRRTANLDIVHAWWYAHGFDPHIVSDGLEGDAPFNRHRAYNRAVIEHPGDTYVFAEADMLIHPDQIMLGIRLAHHQPGIVVPFTQYRYLSDVGTSSIRDAYHDLDNDAIAAWWGRAVHERDSLWDFPVESTMEDGRSIGAVNIVSRKTLTITGGFTEATSGNWYDDNITEEGFKFLTGTRTSFVPGPAVHLYHLPGSRGDHLTEEDKRATANNKRILLGMRRSIRAGNISAVRRVMQARA